MKIWNKRQDLIKKFDAKLPKHVAIIMDGNGRWAKKRGLPRALGHRAGVERVKDIIRLTSDLGINALSLYAFSTENWKRSKEEVGALMSLLIEYMEKEVDELDENNVIITTMGDLSALPLEVQNSINSAVRRTSTNNGLTVCFALNYGSRQEIVDAVRRISDKVTRRDISVDEIDSQTIERELYTNHLPELDLLIRTSGEYRLSNFMLYQLAYAEMHFTDVLWPDFDEGAYLEALESFSNRNRRFGGV